MKKSTKNPKDIQKTNVKTKPLFLPDVQLSLESGGPKGLEPTRYGDWEKNGKCVDF